MKRNSTPIITTLSQREPTSEKKKKMQPSEKTLHFLKHFARNYQVESSMPEGLQGFILG